MLCYDRTDVSDGIDINKTSASKEYKICHYWYFLGKGFKSFNLMSATICHDILMMSINLNDIAILSINGADYCYLLRELAKMTLQMYCNMVTWQKKIIDIKINKFITTCKMGKEIVTFGNIEVKKHKFH